MAKFLVGLGDLAASGEPGDVLVAQALGSCVALLLRDPSLGIGVMGHVVVPGEPGPNDVTPRPAYHAAAAVRNALDALKQLGGSRSPKAVLVGGASIVDSLGAEVGRRNVLAVRRALWAQGIVPAAEEVGGTLSRTVHLDVSAGVVRIQSPNQPVVTLEQELQ